MDAHLEIAHKGDVREKPCSPIMTIGRGKKNDLVIHDTEVSRNHAMIRRLAENDYYYMDVGSSNGSSINKKRVVTPTLLNDGDQIRLGDCMITFHQANKEETEDDAEPCTVIRQRSAKIEQITILVSDIRGYTTLSEQVQINTLSKFMSKWFQQVQTCIQDNAGTVDKFIGDCVYARWHDGRSNHDSVIHALKSALMINEITQKLKKDFPEIEQPLNVGAGINTGSAALGLSKDITAVGDAVNITFRLESATKELGKDIVLSADAYTCLPEELWQQQTNSINVKGKSAAVEVWGVMYEDVDAILKKTE